MRVVVNLKSYDGIKCHWCQRQMDIYVPALHPTRDHYPVPRSRRGARTVIACYTCNHIKGDMGAAEWHGFMAVNPEWWKRPTTVTQGPPRVARPRGVRVIRQKETPSAPMRAALEQHAFTRLVSRAFDERFVRDDPTDQD